MGTETHYAEGVMFLHIGGSILQRGWSRVSRSQRIATHTVRSATPVMDWAEITEDGTHFKPYRTTSSILLRTPRQRNNFRARDS